MTDKTLTRIAALLRKAESTDNEHEADAFLQAAQRLATLASVDLAVARAHTADRERRVTPAQREVVIGESGKRGLRTYVDLYLAIARANDVRCDIARDSTRVFAYGFDTDLDMVGALYRSLIVQMVRASDEFIKSGRYAEESTTRWSAAERRWVTRPIHATTARVNFQRAFAGRVGQRLKDARARATAERVRSSAVGADAPWASDAMSGAAAVASGEQTSHPSNTSSGVALALRAKEIEIADHYRANSTARGHWQGSWASGSYSEHATRAGDRAGRTARLGAEQAIGGSRPSIRS